VVAKHEISHLCNHIKTLNIENKVPTGDLARYARNMFQCLHSEGLIAQGLVTDWYCERSCEIGMMPDEDLNPGEIGLAVERLDEAHSS
jgi:hypothetical protein